MVLISVNNWHESLGFICKPRTSEGDRASTLKTVGSSESTTRGVKKLKGAGQVRGDKSSSEQAKTKSEATSSTHVDSIINMFTFFF